MSLPISAKWQCATRDNTGVELVHQYAKCIALKYATEGSNLEHSLAVHTCMLNVMSAKVHSHLGLVCKVAIVLSTP